MNTLTLVLVCLCGADSLPRQRSTARPPVAAQQTRTDAWFGPDKVKHFFVSAFIHSAAFSASRAVGASHSNAQVIASVSSAAFGIGKEIHDKRRSGPFSARDLVWDAAGALTAASLLNGTR